jgi:hypothetical protein
MMRFRWGVIIVGVTLALVAIRLDDRRVAWVALAVLSLALLLRFAVRRPGGTSDGRRGPVDNPPDEPPASS